MPDFLGGTCTLFGAHRDGVGPWNEYDFVQPVGIKKRQITNGSGQEEAKSE